MKSIIALAVIAFCAIQMVSGNTKNLNSLKNDVTRQKSAVTSTLNRLDRSNKDFSFNLNNQLSNVKTDSMQEINSIVNPALQNIRDAIAELTENGKDASHCYEPARLALREYSQTGYDDLDDCRNDALQSVSQTQNNINSAILTGKSIVSDLDSIFTSCYNTNTQKMESCIVDRLSKSTQAARAFETTASSVTASINSATTNAKTIAINCNRGPVSIVRDRAITVQADAKQCIAAV